MLTIEQLDKMVTDEYKDVAEIMKAWPYYKLCLTLHQGGGQFLTYFDEFAHFCWKCGCNLFVNHCYWSGDCEFYVSLPKTEEDYADNLREGGEFWNETIE